jgi:hypothetical protein
MEHYQLEQEIIKLVRQQISGSFITKCCHRTAIT